MFFPVFARTGLEISSKRGRLLVFGNLVGWPGMYYTVLHHHAAGNSGEPLTVESLREGTGISRLRCDSCCKSLIIIIN